MKIEYAIGKSVEREEQKTAQRTSATARKCGGVLVRAVLMWKCIHVLSSHSFCHKVTHIRPALAVCNFLDSSSFHSPLHVVLALGGGVQRAQKIKRPPEFALETAHTKCEKRERMNGYRRRPRRLQNASTAIGPASIGDSSAIGSTCTRRTRAEIDRLFRLLSSFFTHWWICETFSVILHSAQWRSPCVYRSIWISDTEHPSLAAVERSAFSEHTTNRCSLATWRFFSFCSLADRCTAIVNRLEEEMSKRCE